MMNQSVLPVACFHVTSHFLLFGGGKCPRLRTVHAAPEFLQTVLTHPLDTNPPKVRIRQ